MTKRRGGRVWLGLLVVLLIGVVFGSLAWGPVYVPVPVMVAVIGHQFNIPGLPAAVITPEQAAVIWHIRLPRVLVGLLAGSALGVAGAVLQGVFGNPLADPGIIGVSSGAALGAVAAIALGLTTGSIFYMPLLALAGGLLAVAVTVGLALRQGKIPAVTLLLAGVAVSMFLNALTAAVLTFMNEQRMHQFLFWLVGGLDYRRWEHVYLAVGPVLAGIFILCLLARQLNILVLGETEARAVGMPVATLRLVLLLGSTVTTAAAVCVSGSIGFVGLLVPHIMRLLLGPDHRTLLPACALAGGLFLVGCDTLGRLIMPPAEIRVGIVTAVTGAPYFLYLLRRTGEEGEVS